MTGLRWRPRVVHHAVVTDVTAILAAAGWLVSPPPLGSGSVVVRDATPDEKYRLGGENLVVVTVGDVTERAPVELGLLVEQVVPVFVDVYAENPAVAVSVASDVADALYERSVQLVDLASGLPVDEWLFYEKVAGPAEPPVAAGLSDFRRHWRVVKAMGAVQFKQGSGV